ncbi:MAG: serpin family protein [Polyangiales bacterium]
MKRLLLALAVGLCGCDTSSKCAQRESDSCLREAPPGVLVAKSSLARQPQPSTANVARLGADNGELATQLFKLAAQEPGNVLLSPYSVSTALAMTYAGARGTTESEMKKALAFKLDPAALHEAFNATDLALSSRGANQAGADGTPFRLNVDNSIWVQQDYDVVPAFLDALAVNYGAAVYQADFEGEPEQARTAINGWVEDKTEQLIPELLQPGVIHPLVRFVLTNTVYFNASWKAKFEQEATRPQAFRKRDGSSVNVDMMHGGFTLPYAENDVWQAVSIPYASEELSLIAVLPREGQLSRVESGFDVSAIAGALEPASVQLGFPKLDYRFQIKLKEALMALGMNVPFSPAADFSGMTSGGVSIDNVIHEAVIRVFEGGTIAAAATAVVVKDESEEYYEHTLTLDRPFLYAIYDRPTGTVLFVGRVQDPTEK